MRTACNVSFVDQEFGYGKADNEGEGGEAGKEAQD